MVQYPFAWFRRTWPYASLFLLTAALGILSGLALFVFWWENSGKDGPLVVLGLALGVVTLTSFIFEKLRELVEAHKPHWSVRGVLGSIVTLAVFELFITAIHASVEAGPWKHVAIAKIIFGADFPFLASDGWNALALAGLWLVVGLAIGWQLMIIVRRCDLHPSSPARESIFGAAAGAFGAIIWGGFATVLYVLFWRSYSIADLARTNSSEWQYLVSPYTYFRVEHLFRWILCAPSILLLGWGTRHFGSAGFVAVVLLCLLAAGYLASRHTVRWLAVLPLIGLFLVLIFPLVSSADARLQLWQLAKMTSVVWGIPAALLGALAPALRKPSEKPPYWGMIAFSAALVLAVAAALRLFQHEWRSAETWFLVLGVIVLLLAGLALAGGRSALELWPLVALSIGILICGSTAAVQKLHLLGYQNSIAGLIDTGTSPLLSSVLQSAMGDYLSGDLTAPAQKTSPEDSAAVKNKIPIRKRSGLGSRWDHWIDWLNGKTEIRINDWTGQKSQEEVLRRSYWSTSPTAYSPSTTSERITDCAGATRLVENLALYAPQHLQELRGEAGPQPGPEGPVSVVRRGDYEETFQVYDQIVEVVPGLLSTAATALDDARRARAMCSVSKGQQFDAAAAALDATSVELVKLYDDTLKKRSQLVFKLAGALEIIMTGSLGFWLTVGILGTWARLRVNSLAPEED